MYSAPTTDLHTKNVASYDAKFVRTRSFLLPILKDVFFFNSPLTITPMHTQTVTGEVIPFVPRAEFVDGNKTINYNL
jgi:hypothetical protein